MRFCVGDVIEPARDKAHVRHNNIIDIIDLRTHGHMTKLILSELSTLTYSVIK